MPTKEELLRQQQEAETAKVKTPPASTPTSSGDKTEKQKADDAEEILRRRKAEISIEVANRQFKTNEDWEAKLKADQAKLAEEYQTLGKAQAELQKRITECNQKRQEAVTLAENTKRWAEKCNREMAEAVKLRDSIEQGRLDLAEQEKALQEKQIAYDVECQPAIDLILATAKALTRKAGQYQDAGMQAFADYLCRQAEQIEQLMIPKQPITESLPKETTSELEQVELDMGKDTPKN